MTLKYQKTEDGDFKCPVCGQIEHNQSTMHYHMKRHQAPPTCEHCDREFLNAAALKTHLATRHAKEEAALMACPHPSCQVRAKSRENLLIHFLGIHCRKDLESLTAECTTCASCGKVCKSRRSLLYHFIAQESSPHCRPTLSCPVLEAQFTSLMASQKSAPLQ